MAVEYWLQKCAPGDPWIHFFNGYFEIYLFFNLRNDILFNSNLKTFLIGYMLISYNR
jgi:hypothetical protein